LTTRTKTTVSLHIDDRTVQASPNETVLDVARREGVDIPALCSEAGTAGWGACRLCLVEIEGTAKLQAACTTKVAEDMVVRTDTPRVRARRESYLRMYLSDHNAYCEAPCTHACPTHLDIPGYLAALAAGEIAVAAAIVRRELPFPGVLGRICPRYCEPVCRRGDVDEPIAICALHRAVADNADSRLVAGSPTGKRVAVIGAGPAGLSAAWFLTKAGHQVTLYDRNEQAGGLLRYGSPEFRLPVKVLDQELQPLWDAGVRFVGGAELGYDLDSGTLLSAGFAAQIISTGNGEEPVPVVAGAEEALQSLDVLRRVREGARVPLGKDVVVVGESISAIDVARTARRLGAERVVVVMPDTASRFPTLSRDLKAAIEEGIGFEFHARLEKVMVTDGVVKGVECVRVASDVQETGAEAPHFTVDASTVILSPVETPGPSASNLYTGRTLQASVFKVRGRDSVSRSAIHAVADGKRVALAVDAWLGGESLGELEERLAAYADLPYLEQLAVADELGVRGKRMAQRAPVWLKMGVSVEPASRVAERHAPKSRRLSSLDIEVNQGLSLASARAEAARCLQCVCPSLGECDLQRLGVEYGITENKLVTKVSRVREVPSQHEHPFIRRDMNRCIACGRCVRACRDVAGPACYDFTGRGFAINVDTAYGDSLQLAGCISCGRCVTTCPTGALLFNERVLSSFEVDESRCIMCRECVGVCPVGAIKETDHFEEARRQWHEVVARGSELAGGHRMCAGCGAPVVVRQVLMGTTDPVVISSATGCLEVSTTIYPYTSWKSSFIHTAFENSAATLSGVETAFRALKKKGLIEDNVKFIAFGGDGGTYDIGLQSLSGAMERGHRMLYVCYDNGAYMNTGFQRSGATPVASWTTTSPVGEEMAGKLQHRKNLTDIMIAHNLEYVAQASPHDPRDLVRKAAKALAVDGPTFLNVLAPCPRGWRSEGAESIDLAREAVNTCYWPLFEVEGGKYRLNYRPHYKLPLVSWLKRQGRFAHLFTHSDDEALLNLETWVALEWEKLLEKCGEPSEADWQAHLQAKGCLLR
jgi:pyruvate/2-oxoacid:ferredoxin oxidoreductase beta subunit/NADPH-dependent glutamate synthase beta subunit-like oxidoreductase/ferredoxin